MNPKRDVEGWCMLGLGVLVLAIGFDLTGRLFWFLYDESVYFVVGLVVVAFVTTLVFVWMAHKDQGLAVRATVDEVLSEFRGQNSHIEERVRAISKSIACIKGNVEEQSKLCERAIEKAEALLNPKPPVLIPLPEPTPPEEEQMQDAIEEVVGGAL